MKTKIKLLAMLILFASIVPCVTRVSAQVWTLGPLLPGPYDMIQSNSGTLTIMKGVGTFTSTAALTALGVNTETPAYMLDVYGGDIDINCASCTFPSYGYRIGTQMVLWNGGNTSDIYVGVAAGNSGTGANSTALGYNALHNNMAAANTAVGYYALYTNTVGGGANTGIGAQALFLNLTGNSNTAIGWEAMYTNSTGAQNTAIGWSALYKNTATGNTAMGYNVMYSNTIGTSNTAVGWSALSTNISGNSNTAYGLEALGLNSTGSNNTAVGYTALINNQAGNNNTATGTQALLNSTADNNTAMGYQSLFHNTTGTHNVAVGIDALFYNSIQGGNVAIGDSALYSQSYTGVGYNLGNVAVGNSALFNNQSISPVGNGFNTALGEWALRHNTDGAFNTATGGVALYANTQGVYNTANGYEALYFNTLGSDNTAVGYQALYANAIAFENTALGYEAGSNNIGNNNTFLGYGAGYGCNLAAMGNDAFLGYNSGPAVPGSNTIYLGNGSTSAIEAVSAITISSWSDRRIKDSIKANIPGLAFINRLQPVTFHYSISKENQLMGVKDSSNWSGKYDVEKITQSGFIAQQVDSAAQACGYNFCGVTRPNGPNQPYTLGYTTFVVPLVKAVQELNAKNDTLRSTVDSLRSLHVTVDSLRTVLKSIQNCLNQLCNTSGEEGATAPGNKGGNTNSNSDANALTNVQNITLSSSTGAPLLYQNTPNPFSTGTKINYYLPEGTMGATIVFYDTYGNQLKTVQLTQTGNGTLNITPDNLSNGIYSYSLVLNGSVIDTKRMMLQK